MIPAIDKIRLKLETPWSLVKHKFNKMVFGQIKANDFKFIEHGRKLKSKYLHNEIWNFNGVRLPLYKRDDSGGLMYLVYLDSLFIYCKHKENYHQNLIDKLEQYIPEGPYGYTNNSIDVTVKENDIVIDAGAWIGDFSAYASAKGAKIFAFEPSKENICYLEQTQKLNSNIHVIGKGLGDKSGIYQFSNNLDNSLIYQITQEKIDSEQIEVTTIDEFVRENNIEHIDFIKADIEGFERYMLMGAKETLRKFAPKLAICTYHLPDDPGVLAKIILDANPNYIIVQKRKKLYAQVPFNQL